MYQEKDNDSDDDSNVVPTRKCLKSEIVDGQSQPGGNFFYQPDESEKDTITTMADKLNCFDKQIKLSGSGSGSGPQNYVRILFEECDPLRFTNVIC